MVRKRSMSEGVEPLACGDMETLRWATMWPVISVSCSKAGVVNCSTFGFSSDPRAS